MLTRVQNWGNSQGIRIPKAMLKESHIRVGDEVSISIRDGQIILKPVNKIRDIYKIKELVAKIHKTHEAQEDSWGEPVGREAW